MFKNILNKVGSFLFILLIILSCSKDRLVSNELDFNLLQRIETISPESSLNYYLLPQEDDYDHIPQDLKNPLTKDKVLLGKFLFYETGFARTPSKPEGIGTYSCASCHIPEVGFKPNNFQGVADGGIGFGVNGNSRVRNPNYLENELDVQSARPLSLVNVAFVKNTFWNGQFGSTGANIGTENVWSLREDTKRNYLGFEGIETVNFEGLFTHRIKIDSVSVEQFGYKNLFDLVFGDIPSEERYNNSTASLAISSYLRTILANKAPFQHWLNGNHDAMTQSMKNGALLFFGKANCYRCHYEPNLGSLEFHSLGVKDMYQRPSYDSADDDKRNLGRGGFTHDPNDNFKFKVPGLYNVGDSPFYFHGASKLTLEEVIQYKIEAKSENTKIPDSLISQKFRPLKISEVEIEDLLEFLSNGLRDPDLIRYQPDSLLSGNCFPNADFQSSIDLGCE